RITIGLACNADGSEKLEPIFIGKSLKPRCFKRQTPEQSGFYYRSNKKAWMTSSLFEECVVIFICLVVVTDLPLCNRWLKKLNLRMKREWRNICLYIDNFSGH